LQLAGEAEIVLVAFVHVCLCVCTKTKNWSEIDVTGCEYGDP